MVYKNKKLETNYVKVNCLSVDLVQHLLRLKKNLTMMETFLMLILLVLHSKMA